MSYTDILTRIKEKYDSISKGQKKIADFILLSYDKAAYMTAQKLSQAVHTSESTVVRFACQMDCDGYSAFQRELQEVIRHKLTSVQRMEVASDRLGDKNILRTVMQSDLEKIKQTMEEIDEDAFHNAAEQIVTAKKVYILGVRSSASLAEFLYFYMNLILDNTVLVRTDGISEVLEQVIRADKQDVVIAISFPRYSKRTVRAVQYAASRGSTVIAITDSKISPINKYATHSLTARSDMVSFVDSLVAPLSLINALTAAVAMRRSDRVHKHLEYMEHIWEEYNVYEKEE